MHLSNLLFPALVLLTEIHSTSAKAIISSFRDISAQTSRRSTRSSDTFEHTLSRDLYNREALPQPSSTSSSPTSGLDSICSSAISHLGAPSNPAGLLACYDIIALDTTTGSFQSTVQIYQAAKPSGNFTGVEVHSAVLNLQYPAAFLSALSRRVIKRTHETRASITPELIVSKSYAGELQSTLQLSKLNTTELISLLIPNITIEALSSKSGLPIFTQINAGDIAFFPSGVFSRTQHAAVLPALANPSGMASAAMIDAAVFVLPGTHFGIFPVGLIVTGAWCALFLGVFTMGTLGRIKHQKQFRQRIANPRFGSR